MRLETLKKDEKIIDIFIIGRRWFEKINGNTYHSAMAYINGILIGHVDFVYGYGDHYIQTGVQILRDNGFLSDLENNCSIWRHCDEHNIRYVYSVYDVSRKRDLYRYCNIQ